MEKLKKYIRKNLVQGLTYESMLCGNNYFDRVKAPIYEMLVLQIDHTRPQTENSKLQAVRRKIEKYCSRYGYEIINTFSHIPGETRIYIAKAYDHAKYKDYQSFVNASVEECNLLRHLHGFYTGLGRDMEIIMNNYESAYLQFLQDQETGKTA